MTPGNGGAEKCFSVLHFADRPAHVVGGSLLEQKSPRAGIGGVFHIRVIAVRGEHDDLGAGHGFHHLARGFQTIEQRHRDVHQHHFGMKFFCECDRRASVLRLADDFKIVFEFEHLAETFAHDHVVFGEQDSDSFHDYSSFVSSPNFFARGGGRFGEWNFHFDGGAFAGRGFDRKSAADHFDAFPHAEQSEALAAFGIQHAFDLKGFAVVFYFHADAVRQFFDAHFHAAGFRMAGHIGERFLCNPKEHRALGGRQLFHFRKGLQVNVDAGLRSESFS